VASHNVYRIYCYGADSKDTSGKSLGGWGAILRYDNYIKEIWGVENNYTDKQLSLLACVEALKLIKFRDKKVEIYIAGDLFPNVLNNGLSDLHATDDELEHDKEKNNSLKLLAEGLNVCHCEIKDDIATFYINSAKNLVLNALIQRGGGSSIKKITSSDKEETTQSIQLLANESADSRSILATMQYEYSQASSEEHLQKDTAYGKNESATLHKPGDRVLSKEQVLRSLKTGKSLFDPSFVVPDDALSIPAKCSPMCSGTTSKNPSDKKPVENSEQNGLHLGEKEQDSQVIEAHCQICGRLIRLRPALASKAKPNEGITCIRCEVKQEDRRKMASPETNDSGSLCPVCSGTGHLERKLGPRTSHMVSVTCTNCMGSGYIYQNYSSEFFSR